MYKQTTTIIKGEEVRTKEFIRTAEKTLEILSNLHTLIKYPTENDKVIEYQRIGLIGYTAVRSIIEDDGIVKIIVTTVKEI